MSTHLPPQSKWVQEAQAALREYEKTCPPVLSPCMDQTVKDVEAYYGVADVGAVAVVRQTQNHQVKYSVSSIGAVPVRSGRVYVEGFGAFYRKNGKNCFHPTGQTRLVVPTEQVLSWAAAHPCGEGGVRYWRKDEGSIL